MLPIVRGNRLVDQVFVQFKDFERVCRKVTSPAQNWKHSLMVWYQLTLAPRTAFARTQALCTALILNLAWLNFRSAGGPSLPHQEMLLYRVYEMLWSPILLRLRMKRRLFAEILLKRRRVEKRRCYFRWLPVSASVFKCLWEPFSKAGYALSDRRRWIATVNSEQQIFLHATRSMWDIADLSTLLDWVLLLRQIKLVGHSLFSWTNTDNFW